MGYRSDVTIYMYAVKEENAPVVKLWLQENFPVEHWAEYIDWTKKGMLFKADHIKWYDDYSDVKEVHEALDKFQELFIDVTTQKHEMPECAYEFVRIGEDYEDIDIRQYGQCDYALEVNRETVVNI